MEIPVYTSSLGSVAEMEQIRQSLRVLRYPRDPGYFGRPFRYSSLHCSEPDGLSNRFPSCGEFDLAACVLLNSEDGCTVFPICRYS
jgi:hypothetical protein